MGETVVDALRTELPLSPALQKQIRDNIWRDGSLQQEQEGEIVSQHNRTGGLSKSEPQITKATKRGKHRAKKIA